MITLQSERLILRAFKLSDARAMDHVFGDAEVMRFGDGAKSRRWIKNWLHQRINEYQSNSQTRIWAIIEKTRDVAIGYCGLFYFPDMCGEPETEIGYRLAAAYWGRGFATEAAQVVLDHAFHTLGIKRLIALIDPDNVNSISVAKKLGMHYEKDVMLADYTHPDHIYVIENKQG